MFKYILLFFFYGVSVFAYNQNEYFNLKEIINQNQYAGKYLKFLKTSEELNIQEILKKPFQEWSSIDKDIPNFGFDNQDYWFLLNLKNDTLKSHYYIEISYPLLDYVDIWIVKNNEVIFLYQFGDQQDYKKIFIVSRYFFIPLEIQNQEKISIYFKIKSTSSIQLPLKILEPNQFFQQNKNEVIMLGIYGGILLIISLYNFIVYFALKDINFIYLSIFIIIFLIGQYSINGIMYEYFFYSIPWLNEKVLMLSVVIGNLFALLFASRYLEIHRYKKINLIYRFLMYLFSFFIVISVSLSYKNSIRIVAFSALLTSLVLILSSIYFAFHKFRPSYFFLTAWVVFLIGVILFVLKTFAIVPTNFVTIWSIQIGSALQIFLLSIGLLDKINQIRNEKEMYQSQLLQTKENMIHIISRFVPRDFLQLLQKDIMEIQRGDAIKKQLSIMFCDIRNFTYLSENLHPEEVFSILNTYFDYINNAITKYYGFIDKYIGDEVMVIFKDNVESSINSALEIFVQLDHFKKNSNRHFDIGVAIHSGEMILGTLGSHNRWDTTVIGDTVNTASRLEKLNKFYKTNLLITDTVYRNIENKDRYFVRRIDRVLLRGKVIPKTIYEVFNMDPDEIKEKKLKSLTYYEEALNHYYKRNFNEALKLFNEIKQHYLNDYIINLYIKRCKKLILFPPSEEWGGFVDFNLEEVKL